MSTSRTSRPSRKSQSKIVKIKDLPQKLATGYLSAYSNYAEVGSSPMDFNFVFFEIVEDETGQPVREKKARVVMTPQHAIQFAQVLDTNLQNWMKENTSFSDDDLEKIRRGEKPA